MAQILEYGPEQRGRPAKYPWDEWSQLVIHDPEVGRWRSHWRRLTKGEDFDSTPKSFRVLAHRTAKMLGKQRGIDLKVETTIESPTQITILFYVWD